MNSKWNRIAVWMVAAMASSTVVACGEDAPPAADEEACEHFAAAAVMVTATTAKDGQTPVVAADHKAYLLTLPTTGIGYVKLDVAEAGDVVFFLDRAVTLAVQNSMSMPVSTTSSATSSAACDTIKARHVVAMTAGSYFVALGPDAMPFSLVIE